MADANAIPYSTLEGLNRAALAVTSQLTLDKTLQQIADSARELVGARYAALGIPDSEGHLVQFVFSGITAEEASRIAHPPRGTGLLGVLLREGRSIRLPRLSDHPRSSGFPPGHPAMTSFLGVPIVASGQVVGNLYLTDKIGADEFSETDQAIVELLAAHAAVAVHNARLYQAEIDRSRELAERNRELAALNAVAVATSQHLDLGRVMSEALDHVLAVSQADAAEIYLLDETSGDMIKAMHRGDFEEVAQPFRRFKKGHGIPGQVAALGQPIVVPDTAADERFVRRALVEAGLRSFLCVPLFSKGSVVGTLNLASRRVGAFDEASVHLLSAVGHQIGVAVENARLYEQVARLAVLEERARIGMDLHDGVIQSIYAVGLTLEFCRLFLAEDPQAARERLDQAIAGLNEAIRDIRNYILDLRPQKFDGDLAAGLARLAREFEANTLTPVDLRLGPQAVEDLSPSVARSIFHIAQEALANAAKHAKPTHVRVEVARRDGRIVLEVEDNGRGFDLAQKPERVGHGLANIRARAESLSGTLTIRTAPGQGASLLVSIPLT